MPIVDWGVSKWPWRIIVLIWVIYQPFECQKSKHWYNTIANLGWKEKSSETCYIRLAIIHSQLLPSDLQVQSMYDILAHKNNDMISISLNEAFSVLIKFITLIWSFGEAVNDNDWFSYNSVEYNLVQWIGVCEYNKSDVKILEGHGWCLTALLNI